MSYLLLSGRLKKPGPEYELRRDNNNGKYFEVKPELQSRCTLLRFHKTNGAVFFQVPILEGSLKTDLGASAPHSNSKIATFAFQAYCWLGGSSRHAIRFQIKLFKSGSGTIHIRELFVTEPGDKPGDTNGQVVLAKYFPDTPFTSFGRAINSIRESEYKDNINLRKSLPHLFDPEQRQGPVTAAAGSALTIHVGQPEGNPQATPSFLFKRRLAYSGTQPYAIPGFGPLPLKSGGRHNVTLLQEPLNLDRHPDKLRWRIQLHLPDNPVTDWWNHFLLLHSRSLRRIRGGHHVSVIPSLAPPSGASAKRQHWRADYHVRFRSTQTAPNPDGNAYVSIAKPIYPTREIALRGQLELMRNHSGKQPKLNLTVNQLDPDEIKEPFGGSAFTCSIGDVAFEDTEPTVRISGLDLRFGGKLKSEYIQHSSLCLKLLETATGEGSPTWKAGHHLEANLWMAIFDVRTWWPVTIMRPAGQDRLLDERFADFGLDQLDLGHEDDAAERTLRRRYLPEAPLVICRTPPQANTDDAQFYLQGRELTAYSKSRRLHFSIQRLPSTSIQYLNPTVIIDRTPSVVAQVHTKVPTEQARPGEESMEVATLTLPSPRGLSWQWRYHKDGFYLRLPAQGICEEMEKMAAAGDLLGIAEGARVRFRFTPPTMLRLLASELDRSMGEAPWNFRRLFGQYPGALLRQAWSEFLYGLSVRFDAQYLHLGELMAYSGEPAGILDRRPAAPWEDQKLQEPIHRKLRHDLSVQFQRYLSRLAVLEPWDRRQPEQLVIREGLTYELRRKAKLAQPINLDEEPTVAESGNLLKGGATWGIPFTSRNLLRLLARHPKTTQGYLAEPYFSALGGWAKQKAAFADGRIKIYGDVAMGRTYFYSVEIPGRISIFWNRAKYVVIYERTVLPSDQFHGRQAEHRNRPILRKVREYVEVLEPVRRFDQESQGSPNRCGCLLGCEFKSTIMPVDESWGQDVAEVGWKIPVYRKGLPEKLYNPQVYVKPQILAEIAADPEGEVPSHLREITDPEKIHFFVDTTDGVTDATDEWVPRESIDYVDLGVYPPDAMHAATKESGFDTEAAMNRGRSHFTRKLFDPPLVNPGLDDFTFHLLDDGARSNLTAGRSGKAISAAVKNVLAMRSSTLPPSSKVNQSDTLEKLTKLEKLRENDLYWHARIAQEIDDLHVLVNDLSPADTYETVKQRVKAKKQRVKKFVKDLREHKKEISDAYAGIVDPKDLDSLCERLKREVVDLIVKTRDITKEEVIGTALDRLDEKLDDLETVTADAKQTIIREVSECCDALIGYVDRVPLTLAGVRSQIQTSIGEVSSRVDGMFAETNAAFKELGEDFQTAQNTAKAHCLAFGQKISAARVKLGKVNGSINEPTMVPAKPAFVKDAGNAFKTSWDHYYDAADALLNELIQGTNELVVEIQNATDLDDLIKGEVKEKLDEIRDNLKRKLNKLSGPADQVFAAFDALLDALKNLKITINGQEVPLHDAPEALIRLFDVATTPPIAEVRAFINQQRGPDGLYGAIDALFGMIQDLAEKALVSLCAVGREVLQQATELIEGLCKELEAQIKKELDPILDLAADTWKTEGQTLLDEARKQARVLENHAKAQADAIVETSGAWARDAAADLRKKKKDLEPYRQQADRALTLYQVAADVPKVPSLAFNRNLAVYAFDPSKAEVALSPCVTYFSNLNNALEAIGVRIPFKAMGDQLLPEALKDLDIRKIMPTCGGINFDHLFNGIRGMSQDAVKLTYGLNRTTRRGWAKLRFHHADGGEYQLFAFGPVTVHLQRPEFRAYADFEVDLDGKVIQRKWGSIVATWKVTMGGSELVQFLDTELSFENGKADFRLSPDRVKLAAILQSISDVIQQIGYSDKGFSIGVVQTPSGIPAGIRAVLDLPLPDVNAGAFSMSNLQLGGLLELRALNDRNKLEFSLALGVNLGRKLSPFSLNILFLGGGGWLDARFRYVPSRGGIEAKVSIGIQVSASVGLQFGPIGGFVAIYFGIFVEFESNRASGSSMAIGAMVLVTGQVTLLGFVQVGLNLLLQARYVQGGAGNKIDALGMVSLKVKIGWCFSIEVRQEVRYQFEGGKSQKTSNSQTTVDHAAKRYVAMLD